MTALTPDYLHKLHAWWRAANYLSVGQIYLRANPLLEQPLTLDHIKPRLLGLGHHARSEPAVRASEPPDQGEQP